MKIEKTTWDYLTPLQWYDMIIIDNTSITSKTVKIAVKARSDFQEFIESGGILICICCRPKVYSRYKSYGWLPSPLSSIEVVAGEAYGLKIKRSMLDKFLDRQRDNINVECYFRNIDVKNAKVLATTGLEEVVAFSMNLGRGEIICLPQFKDKNSFLENWLEVWISRKPSWVEKYQYKEKGEL